MLGSPRTECLDQLPVVVLANCDFFFAVVSSGLAVLVALAVGRFDRGAAGCFFGSVFFAVGWAFLAVRRGLLAGTAVFAVAFSDLGWPAACVGSRLVVASAAAGGLSDAAVRREGFFGKARSGGRLPSKAGRSRVRMFR